MNGFYCRPLSSIVSCAVLSSTCIALQSVFRNFIMHL